MQYTILVVDDDPHVLQLLGIILTRLGYQVLTADSGASALTAWENRSAPVDLLLTDVFMPDMNGPQLAAALDELQPGLKVVYISGASREQVDALFLHPDEIRLLKKPASPEILAACVRDAIQGE